MDRKVTLAFILMMVFISGCATGGKSVTIDTRPGVTQTYLVKAPDSPIAIVLLFTGSHGNLDISGNYVNWGDKAILVHSRRLFTKNNILTVLIDAPSDKKGSEGMFEDMFRSSAEHATDVDKVMEYISSQYKLPIWLVGMSRGTESIVNVATRTNRKIDGLVLMSTVYRTPKGRPVPEFALELINAPVLLIAHKSDECRGTPPEGAKLIADMLTSSKNVVVKYFEGGDFPKGRKCSALAAHGFPGLENEVIGTIAKFISEN